MKDISENKKTVKRYLEGFRGTDRALILSCLADDVTWEIPGMFTVQGKTAFEGHIVEEGFQERPQITVRSLTEEGDMVAAEGHVRTERTDGTVIHLEFCDMFEMRDGKIRRLVSYLMEPGSGSLILPLVPGLTWREVTLDDLPALVDLANTCTEADGGLAFLNQPANLQERCFPDAPGSAIGAFTQAGGLAAAVLVHLAHKGDTVRAVIVGQVRPEWRGRGIGTYLMRWSQAQAEGLFAAAPADKRLLQIAAESLTDAADRLYRAHGFTPVMEELVMQRDLTRPLPNSPLLPGVALITWGPGLEALFFRAYHASFQDRPGFPGYSPEEWIADQLEDENARPDWSLLAVMDGSPVGFLTAGTEHPGGFVVQVGVVPGQRRRGLASALIVESMRRMQADGETAVQLTVNLNNPGAILAYERLGFEPAGRRARYERSGQGPG